MLNRISISILQAKAVVDIIAPQEATSVPSSTKTNFARSGLYPKNIRDLHKIMRGGAYTYSNH
jgi:hypothetical protein